MEDITERYFDYLGEKQDFFAYVNSRLVGKTGTITYRTKRRKAVIREVFYADYWGITVHIGILRLDGHEGFVDNHNANYIKLKEIDLDDGILHSEEE